jgi:hypothetical protein
MPLNINQNSQVFILPPVRHLQGRRFPPPV